MFLSEFCFFSSLGSLFFPLLFFFIRYILTQVGIRQLDNAALNDIAIKLVSAVQGIICCIVGSRIIIFCSNDVMYDRCELTEKYIAFGLPYMIYDVCAIYNVFRIDNRVKCQSKWLLSWRFFTQKSLLLFHHLALPVIYIPIIFYFRNGKGDFFVGCFFLMELAVPWLSFHHILQRLNATQGSLYIINGCILLFFFTLSRVLIFPCLYYFYGKSIGRRLMDIPFLIPLKCNFGCLLLFLLQGYWWVIIAKKLYCKLSHRISHKKNTSKCKSS